MFLVHIKEMVDKERMEIERAIREGREGQYGWGWQCRRSHRRDWRKRRRRRGEEEEEKRKRGIVGEKRMDMKGVVVEKDGSWIGLEEKGDKEKNRRRVVDEKCVGVEGATMEEKVGARRSVWRGMATSKVSWMGLEEEEWEGREGEIISEKGMEVKEATVEEGSWMGLEEDDDEKEKGVKRKSRGKS